MRLLTPLLALRIRPHPHHISLFRRNPSLSRSFASPGTPFKPPQYGQPLSLTHPHLVRPGQLTPGISVGEYEKRRKQLVERVEQDAIIVSMGAKTIYCSQNIFYKFRQGTDFNYLTGFNEPEAAVIIRKDASPRGYHMTLFVPVRSAESDLWEGGRSGLDGAVEFFGADEAYPLSSMPSVLQDHLYSAPSIYIDLPPSKSKRSFLSGLLSSSSSATSDIESQVAKLPPGKVKPLNMLVQALRLVKSPEEVALMKQAGDIASKGHTEVMKFARPDLPEAHLQAHFEYICALEGSERSAYVPVVASGANGLVIHYTVNDCLMKDGELVLIDAGCELHSYCSDITRTFPVSGKFSPAQKDLYQAVLEVNKRCVALCEVNNGWTMNSLHTRSVTFMKEELNQIGFGLSHDHAASILYPHGLSHYLGMDLHDTPLASKSTPLQNGHVLTIEPGVYVPYDSRYPKHFHGLGIRVEDDILITPEGPLVLTSHCPKEVADVEAACQGLLG
ncbi:Putative Xaa-Pro aminopeptidase [Phaffia rhodozyma]|uniref:Putative Xaa-Pro aminopeptidase n=1 Tax=Phaffia rhodozyma TaxID=264483 RepID=A0A0F7SPK1_PHARH|nr:Putative Xaa-Pro aminopeptidase [Phaffia rhodozyma]